ncbi:MAG: glycosyltransferase family 8 protein, partial [Eubacterium sp.]
VEIYPIRVDDKYFEDAPNLKRLSKETYYRLFAPLYLPKSVDRVLYLDPDTIVINPLINFYSMDFGGNLILGAKHFDGFVDRWNKGRLFINNKSPHYINAGIMLMNISEMRKVFSPDRLFALIRKYKRILFLGDQDALNIYYEGRIETISEYYINLDERCFSRLIKLKGSEERAFEFVKKATMIIHYDGKQKPWFEGYNGRLKYFYDEFSSDVKIPFVRSIDEGA